MKTIVLATGGYDPLHSGHLECFKAAKNYGDILVVGVNSDAWLTRKKGRAFMPIQERLALVSNIKDVDLAIEFNDDDNSAIAAIRYAMDAYPEDNIIFVNGGDRTSDNIPEMSINDKRVKFEFGVGGNNKANSSRWILEEWRAPKTERPWGTYVVLHEVPGMKVKELTVNPGCSLSMQMHNHRSEYWMVSEGKCEVYSYHPINSEYLTTVLNKHDEMKIRKGSWHQLRNPFDVQCRIVEIQYGSNCIEEDIERK